MLGSVPPPAVSLPQSKRFSLTNINYRFFFLSIFFLNPFKFRKTQIIYLTVKLSTRSQFYLETVSAFLCSRCFVFCSGFSFFAVVFDPSFEVASVRSSECRPERAGDPPLLQRKLCTDEPVLNALEKTKTSMKSSASAEKGREIFKRKNKSLSACLLLFLLLFTVLLFMNTVFSSIDEEWAEERRQRGSVYIPRPPGCRHSPLPVRHPLRKPSAWVGGWVGEISFPAFLFKMFDNI